MLLILGLKGLQHNSSHLTGIKKIFLKELNGTSLVVQWQRLCTLNVAGLGSIPGWGTRPHMLQLRLITAYK